MTSVTGTFGKNATSAFYERALGDMQSLRKQAETLQAQTSDGNRLLRSSDDPVAASRMRMLARADTLSKIDTANASQASADLGLADTTMSSMATAITRARELTVQAATGTLSNDQREAIGAEMKSLYDTLFTLSNTSNSTGHALFGGQGTGAAYVIDAGGNPVYTGNGTPSAVSLGEGQSVTPALTGPEFLNFTDSAGNATNLLAMMKGLSDALSGGAADPAAAAQTALGDLDEGLHALTTGQTVVGARLNWIDLTNERRTSLTTLRAERETEIGSVDIADAITRLQQTMTVLEASQASFAKLSSLSLFNQIT